ncbi:hypothetical protein [Pseudomonas monteilii]|uniref:hypothetical protein n=1 Tax=Pseudomonas monteilii TaxID=76759 RepID=UPI001E4A7542|nr:hypothetical protein [Pseudomonas monteilii]MCE0931624.1 hypothetical protein [Pseudomonas monteilii]MCE1009180.1 hypothetical protein [Pseudomonas monteilii]WJO34830.1 hypothetical protein LU690_08690 [Pseudomonas monteilii]WJR41175.1 hypothetical protein LU662_009265 [Pseudomonas monteilii]
MEAILSAASDLIANSEADLSIKGKAFCDLLTAEQWKAARGKSISAQEIDALEQLASDPHFSDKAHCRQRLYELAKIAKIGRALWATLPLSTIVDELKKDIRNGINTPSAYALLGACSVAEHNFELGTYYFNRANHISARTQCVTSFMSLSRAIPSFAALDAGHIASAPAELECIGKVSEFDCSVVSVVAGNSLYINRFIENYARSLAENSHGVFGGIHVHWVKELGEDDAAIDAALNLAKTHLPSINLSAETIADINDKKSYYAQARFLMARRLSAFYKKPLMITDLDFQLCADPREAIKKLALIDVSFLQANQTSVMWTFPWLRSMAGSVWVNNTPAAREFFRLVEQGFDACFNPSWFNWGVDQNLLTTVLEYFKTKSHINFASMSAVSAEPLYNVPLALKVGVKG